MLIYYFFLNQPKTDPPNPRNKKLTWSGLIKTGYAVLIIYGSRHLCVLYVQPIGRYPDLALCASNYSKRLTSATNRELSVQHSCGLSTTPTLLARADATAHAQAQCWKGSSIVTCMEFG